MICIIYITFNGTDKYCLLISKGKSSKIYIGETIIKIGDYKKLLGIKIDSKLYF